MEDKKGKNGISQLGKNFDFDKIWESIKNEDEDENKNKISKLDNKGVKTYTIELLYAGSGDIVFRDIITETGSDKPSENYNIIDKKGIFAPTQHILVCNFDQFFSKNYLDEFKFSKKEPKRHDNSKMPKEDNEHPIVLKYDGKYKGKEYVCLKIDENIKNTYGNMQTTITYNEKEEIINKIVKSNKKKMIVPIELIAVLFKETLNTTIEEDGIPVLYFLKKNHNGVTFTFPGPECFKSGLQDKGCFSIKSNYNGSLSIIKKRIKEIESEYKKIEIEIQGHSRGAITAALVDEKLKENKNELSYHKLPIEIHYLGHDPVAGAPTTAKIFKNSESEDLLEEIRRRPKNPKDIGDKSVVIYSVSSGYPDSRGLTKTPLSVDTNFKPGKLYQAKIIIIDSGDHAVKTYYGKKQNAKYGGQDARKLSDGLYFEFNNRLKKIDDDTKDSKQDALEAIDIIIKKCLNNNEEKRCKFLLNLIYSKSKLTIKDLMKEDNDNILLAFQKKDLTNIIQAVKDFKEKFFPVTGNEFNTLMETFKELCLKSKLSEWAKYINDYEFKFHTTIKEVFFKTLGEFSKGNFKDYISS